VKTTASQTKLLFALFNNHWRGHSPRNAIDMKKCLHLPFKELPMQVRMEEDEASEVVE